MNRAIDRAVDHDVRGQHFAVDAGIRGDHQRAGLVGERADVAAHHAVHAQTAAEDHVALDAGGRPDQAVDAVLRLARLVIEHARLLHTSPGSTTPLYASRAAD